MAGGVAGFISGLESLSIIESLSERVKVPVRSVARLVVVALAVIAVASVGIVAFQNGWFSGEALELERGSSLEHSPTEFAVEQQVALVAAEAQPPPVQTVVVYVTGAVQNPGLYTLAGRNRIGDAVEAAGGFAPEAAAAVVNLAQLLADGMQIHIPRLDEVSSDAPESEVSGGSGAQGMQATTDGGGAPALVNINTADSLTLQTLSGIGPATAQKIIDYRSAYGPFQRKEDIRNVSGIGEKKYAAIEALITV